MRTATQLVALICCLLVVSMGMAQMFPFPGPGRAPSSVLSSATLLLAFNGDNSGADTAREEPLGNLALQAEVADSTSWTKNRGSISANASTAPNGSATADLFTGDGTLGGHYIQQQISVASGTALTAAVWLKAGTTTWGAVAIYDSAYRTAWFNLSTGALGSSEAGVTSSIYSDGDGWYLCAINYTIAAANPYHVTFLTAADGQENGQTSETMLWWGALFLPGTHTAEQAAALYRKTESLQTVWDFSGNLNHGVNGSTAGADTNDFSYLVDATAVAVQGATFGADDNVSGLDALGAAYTIIQCETNTPECNSVDSDSGTWVNGVADVGGAVCDIRTAGGCNGIELTRQEEYPIVLSAGQHAERYAAIKAELNAAVPTGRALAYP